jgi:catechol 2,3-dioxygenase-like lactoylglutathione lyase family enzyme
MMSARLTGVCLITEDVRRLASFYASVLRQEGEGDDHYFYFQVGEVLLSIFPRQSMEGMAPGSTAGAGTGGWVLELTVEDVDAEYARLTALGVDFVKPLRTEPWGARSFWFRDPDGNVVDFLVPPRS